MRVVLQQSAADQFILVGGIAAADFEEELKINHQRNVQVGEFLRATNAKPFGRGNRKTTVSWTGTKEHASFLEAETFLMEHSASIPASGALVVTAEGDGDKVYTLSDAQLQTHDAKRIGLTTIHSYIFIGGDFSEGIS